MAHKLYREISVFNQQTMKGQLFIALFVITSFSWAQSSIEDYKIYQDQGRTFLLQSKYDSAIVAFNKGITLMPYSHSMYYEKGYAAMQLKNYTTAISSFTTLLQKADYKYKARINRGICHFELGNLDQAENDFLTVLALDPDNIEANELLVTVQRTKDNSINNERAIKKEQTNLENTIINRRRDNEQIFWGTVVPIMFWTTVFLTW